MNNEAKITEAQRAYVRQCDTFLLGSIRRDPQNSDALREAARQELQRRS